MDIFQVDEDGLLFISPDHGDWEPIIQAGIGTIFDLDGELDLGIPARPNEVLYVYFPFEDRDLPDLTRLHEVARLGANLVKRGQRVLTHCKMGHNRCALMTGVILTYLGLTGKEAVQLLRQKRATTLYNKVYASYLQALPSSHEE